MSYFMNSKKFFSFFICFACLSCATLSHKVEMPSLEERAVQYAEVLMNKDVAGQYNFMSPSYRENHTIEQFRTQKRPTYANLQFHSIDMKDANHATVYYTTDMELMGFKLEKTRIYFPFELTEHGWFISYKDPLQSLENEKL